MRTSVRPTSAVARTRSPGGGDCRHFVMAVWRSVVRGFDAATERDTVARMGSVIGIGGANWGTHWDEHAERWRQDLAAESDLQLVESLNREVGNNGWVGARAVYLRVLWDELHARELDFSSVGELTRFPGNRRFSLTLTGKQLVFATPPVA